MPAVTGNSVERRMKNQVVEQQSTGQLLTIITGLRDDLESSRAETKLMEDQLNVLVSLIRRSWKGDKTANLHLANIVGIDPADILETAQAQKDKTSSIRNWERLSLKLLQREYDMVKREIEQRQREYIEGRSLYMEEIMVSHQRDMSQFMLHRRSNSRDSLEHVDKQFLKKYKKQSVVSRPPSGNRQRMRSQSVGVQRSQFNQELVGEVTLKELFIQPTAINCNTNCNNNKAQMSAYDTEYNRFSRQGTERQGTERRWKSHESYDDPQRYAQSNLFEPSCVQESDSKVKRSRPFSAVLQRQQDFARSRPKSAGQIAEKKPLVLKCERPLKYETTYPVPSPPKGKNQTNNAYEISNRQASQPEQTRSPPDQTGSGSQRNGSRPNQTGSGTEQTDSPAEPDTETGCDTFRSTQDEPTQSAVKKPPPVYKPMPLNKFEEDLKQMYSMEDEFRRTTLDLQKKLGISVQGMV